MQRAPVISSEQLSAALQRLDPRDWEVLDLSLRRRVPDEALARLFATEPPEVARRRAFAIEHLADELGVQRGEDLGAVLKALLEPATWEEAERQQGEGWQGFSDPYGPPAPAPPVEEHPGEPPAEPPPADSPPDGDDAPRSSETARHFRVTPPPELPPLDLERGRPAAEHTPEEESGEPEEEAEPVWPPASRAGHAGAGPAAQAEAAAPRVDDESPAASEAEPSGEPAGEAPRPSHLAAVPQPPEPAAAEEAEGEEEPPEPAAAEEASGQGPETNGAVPRAPEPVLDMLAERDQEERRQRIRGPLLWALAGGLGAAGLFSAGYVGANWFADDGTRRAADGDGGGTRRFLPNAAGPVAAEPFPSDPRDASCYPTAAVNRDFTLYQRPGSKRTLRIAGRTEWGSPRVLSVVKRRGDWVAVLAPELRNGEIGWMRSKGAKLDCVRWSLHVDLSRRRLYVRKDGRTMRRMTIAIGSRVHPTPKGRFAVTDKLKVVDKGSPYGCCVLALSGHQTRLPADWPGGDRLAVHATSDLSSIGKPVSLGCMRSQPGQVEWLIKTVPLGAPIFIRA
jgi:L,D-transpeptidase-like protein